MRILLSLFCVVLVVLTGCGNFQKPPPPPPPEPVGPQTKAEVYNLISPAINPLRNAAAPSAPDMTSFEREQVMTALKNAIVSYGSLSFGQEAIRELGYEVMTIAQQAGDNERYKLVLVCIDVLELLSMESQLLKRLGERADVILEQPVVRVRGFLDDHEKGDTYAFLELINQRTGEAEKVEARVGDEFNNLKFIRIIGNNKAVLFEYQRIPGLFFEVEAF